MSAAMTATGRQCYDFSFGEVTLRTLCRTKMDLSKTHVSDPLLYFQQCPLPQNR